MISGCTSVSEFSLKKASELKALRLLFNCIWEWFVDVLRFCSSLCHFHVLIGHPFIFFTVVFFIGLFVFFIFENSMVAISSENVASSLTRFLLAEHCFFSPRRWTFRKWRPSANSARSTLSTRSLSIRKGRTVSMCKVFDLCYECLCDASKRLKSYRIFGHLFIYVHLFVLTARF